MPNPWTPPAQELAVQLCKERCQHYKKASYRQSECLNCLQEALTTFATTIAQQTREECAKTVESYPACCSVELGRHEVYCARPYFNAIAATLRQAKG